MSDIVEWNEQRLRSTLWIRAANPIRSIECPPRARCRVTTDCRDPAETTPVNSRATRKVETFL